VNQKRPTSFEKKCLNHASAIPQLEEELFNAGAWQLLESSSLITHKSNHE
jgi:hypothetical protein